MRAMRAAGAAAAVLLAAVVLAGCGDDGSPGAPTPAGATAPATATAPPSPAATAPGPATPQPTTPGPARTTPLATPPPTANPSTERLLRVTRSGGFTGRTRTLLVNGDGSWTLLGEQAKDLRKGRLSPSALEDLRTALREADFAHLPRTATADPPVYDGFTYSFVHGGFEVAADQTALPAALSRVLKALPGFDAA
ncbi:hypothetical protein [Streptomyces sp. NPDC096033]|uniref:hypothetical protein n=1 Tax=Streptomyces sp. NPDC096033 TaxID=3366071 RepID=UPI003803355A